jgi:hypothetical protein
MQIGVGSTRQRDPQDHARFLLPRQQALEKRHNGEHQAVLTADHPGQSLNRRRLGNHFCDPINRISAFVDLPAAAAWRQHDPGVVLDPLSL